MISFCIFASKKIIHLRLNIPSPLEQIHDPNFDLKELEVFVKRDDLIDATISGNKWRKLKYNIEKFYANKYDALLTFGGAFSNHIAAVAEAGRLLKIPVIGIIRGEELTAQSNLTLSKADQAGMKLIFVARDTYTERYERIYHEELRRTYGNVLIVEEGGANYLGAQGVSELMREIEFEPDYIFTAAGTGTTAAGLLLGTSESEIHAVSVLKNGDFLKKDIANLLQQSLFDQDLVETYLNRLHLKVDYHFGGYAKYTNELLNFMEDFTSRTGIKTDQVYTAKMFFAFYEDLKAGRFKKRSRILLLHTGGLQGVLNYSGI